MKRKFIFQFYFRYRLYIFPSVVALSSLFLIIFAIYPQTVKLLENQKVAGVLTDKSKFLATKVSALEGYDENDLSRKVSATLNAFPADKDYGNTLGILQGLLVQSGFVISSISISNASGKSGNVNSFEVRMETKGPRRLLQDLLVNLESSPRIMKVSSIDISSVQSSQTIDAALVIEVLYSPQPQNLGSVDSPLPLLSQKEEELLTILLREADTINQPSLQQYVQRGKANPFE